MPAVLFCRLSQSLSTLINAGQTHTINSSYAFRFDLVSLRINILLMSRPSKPCIGQCVDHAPAIPHRPYTVYMAILYTKQGAVKRPKILVKSTHHPIGCHSKHASAVELLKLLACYNGTAFPAVDYKVKMGNNIPYN